MADPNTAVPELIRGSARLLVEEIRLLEAGIAQVERDLAASARLIPACNTPLSIPGIGLLTATALVAREDSRAQSLMRRHWRDHGHGAAGHGGQRA